VLLHKTWFTGVTTAGVGFTVIVKVCTEPLQPLAIGVTDITPVAAVAPALVAIKDAILPLPDAARPIEAFVFVQL
jgi:hypothetical protein